MEHFYVRKQEVRNKKVYQSLSVKYLEGLGGTLQDTIYVTDNAGVLIGGIGNRERNQSLREGMLYVNKNICVLKQGVDNESEARDIFMKNDRIKSIPVIDSEGVLICEYEIDSEGFYHDLEIDAGTNQTGEQRDGEIIVTLTTFGSRLETVYLTIKSIMYQTMKADRIILYLGEDVGEQKLFFEDELIRAGLTIVRNVENIKPHKKYFFAMQEYKRAHIITVDDDTIYDDALISDLYCKHLEYPDAVICRRGHRMIKHEDILAPYNQWEMCAQSDRPALDICPTGVGGVFYPAGEYREYFLDMEGLRKVALECDDLWLKVIEVLNGIKVCTVPMMPIRIVKNTQETALYKVNAGQKRNDWCLKNLQEWFQINFAGLF